MTPEIQDEVRRHTRQRWRNVIIGIITIIVLTSIVLVLVLRPGDHTVIYTKPGSQHIADGPFHTEIIEGKHNQYAIHDPKRGWCWIMLPHTSIGVTTYRASDMKEVERSEDKEGRAVKPKDIKNVDKYASEVEIHQVVQAKDGNYMVLRRAPDMPKNWGPTWTIWTPELWQLVNKAQGLTK